MTQRELDAKIGRVFATIEARDLRQALAHRNDLTFFFAEVDAALKRERERWRTGELTPG